MRLRIPSRLREIPSHRKEPCLEMLEGLVGRPALADETPEKMGKVDVEWVNEGPRFVPENYGLLLGERSTHPNLVAIGDEDETAEYGLT
jgi:hypothetical protein